MAVRKLPADYSNRGIFCGIYSVTGHGMTLRFQLFAAALAGALVCSAAGAQVRNASSSSSSGRRSSVHATSGTRASTNAAGSSAAAGIQSGQQTSVIQIPPSGRITTAFASDANSFSFDGSAGVPGLGFDFPHLAAISGSSRNGAFHSRHGNHFQQDSFVPILFGGYPYYGDDTGYGPPDQQPPQLPVQESAPQPQIIVIQQPVSSQPLVTSLGSEPENLSASGPESEAAPIRDVGDFILVRRDGRILFASIFSVVGTQLQYITPEGIRHTVAVSDLDADATEQMNEARGTTVQIHN